MKTTACALALILGCLTLAAQDTPSALESDSQGWVDAMPDLNLSGWSILTIPPGGQPASSPQWKREGDLVVCDGKGGHDWLRYDRVLKDFILHVECRFTPIEAGKGYNSGIFVRNSPDATFWHQVQLGGGSGGYFFGNTKVSGQVQRVNLRDQSVSGRVKPAGEWNSFEITCRGPELTVWTNGAVTSKMPNCEFLEGHIGLEAEGYRIEFRNLKIKELRP